jgi:hypothetical protein
MEGRKMTQKKSFMVWKRYILLAVVTLTVVVLSGCFEITVTVEPGTVFVGQTVTITATPGSPNEIKGIWALIGKEGGGQRKKIRIEPAVPFEYGPLDEEGKYSVIVVAKDDTREFGLGTAYFEVVGEPEIVIDDVSAYMDTKGHVWGHVTGVKPEEWAVLCFIKVENAWWTKPSYDSPLSPINQNGEWDIDITTGDIDECATEVLVFMVPADSVPTICDPCYDIPDPPEAVDSDIVNRAPPARYITFASRQWTVKRSDCPIPNRFSDSEDKVWVDEDGKLHLTITFENGAWYSIEVILTESLGYGVYVFYTESRVDILDPNTVLGLFTWDTEAYDQYHREMDIEYARWGNPGEYTNGQFVLQPCSQCPGCSNCSRFRADLNDQDLGLTNMIIWNPGSVEFRVYRGIQYDYFPPISLVHQWAKNEGVPEPGNETTWMNFWLSGGAAPTNGLDSEVVISDFMYLEELPPEMTITIDGVIPYGDTDAMFGGM